VKEDILKRTACHESGHMAAAVKYNLPFVPIMSIRADDESYGRCEIRLPPGLTLTSEDCYNFVRTLFCGYLAEKYAGGTTFDWVYQIMRAEDQPPTEPGDLRSLMDVAKILELTKDHLFELLQETEELVDAPDFVRAVEHLAKALLAHTELDFATAKRIMESSR
jgi:hypothetical protein